MTETEKKDLLAYGRIADLAATFNYGKYERLAVTLGKDSPPHIEPLTYTAAMSMIYTEAMAERNCFPHLFPEPEAVAPRVSAPTAASEDTPVVHDGSLQCTENSSADGTFDADGGNLPLKFAIETKPTHGSVELKATAGEFRYTPAAGYVGDDSFEFSAKNENGKSGTAVVRILVIAEAPRNDAHPGTPASSKPSNTGLTAEELAEQSAQESKLYSELTDEERAEMRDAIFQRVSFCQGKMTVGWSRMAPVR